MGYGSMIDTPMNKAFVAGFKAKYDRPPTDNEGQTYNGMQLIFEGVRKADSVKPAEISKALEGATFDSIYGEVTMRAADHQLVLPNYIGQVQDVDGKLEPVIMRRFEAS